VHGLIARTPLAFGFLSGTLGAETQFHEGDHRAKWPTEQIARWASAVRYLPEESLSASAKPLADRSSLLSVLSCGNHRNPGYAAAWGSRRERAASESGPLLPVDLAFIREAYGRSTFAVTQSKHPPPCSARPAHGYRNNRCSGFRDPRSRRQLAGMGTSSLRHTTGWT